MAAEGLPVQLACRVLGVSESGYYAWRYRPPSARSMRHAWLTDVIAADPRASHGIYGARRVHAELDPRPRHHRRSRRGRDADATRRPQGTARATAAPPPGRTLPPRPTWSTADFARTSRTSCGSPTSPSTPPARARSTARRAGRLLPPGRRLVDRLPPDRGAGHQRAGHGHRATAGPPAGNDHPLRPRRRSSPPGHSPSAPRTPACCPRWAAIGDCYDNAMIESFWGRMQIELLDRRTMDAPASSWPTRSSSTSRSSTTANAATAALGMLTPIEYELRALAIAQ